MMIIAPDLDLTTFKHTFVFAVFFLVVLILINAVSNG